MDYNIELFSRLNEEYRSKPVVPAPPSYQEDALLRRGQQRAYAYAQKYGIAKKRVLEVGCGFGEVAHCLAKIHGCQVVAVDIEDRFRQRWEAQSCPGLEFKILDITEGDTKSLGNFDFIYSCAVLEHAEHPYSLIQAMQKLLAERGCLHLNMGLHRGVIGSHLYRQVFFPWPHLLFADAIFEQYYRATHLPPTRPPWINHLTAAQYLTLFEKAGLVVKEAWYDLRPLDRPFYDRFEDILGRYPIFDLERDMMFVDLTNLSNQQLPLGCEREHPETPKKESSRPETFVQSDTALRSSNESLRIENERLQSQLQKVTGSLRWKWANEIARVARKVTGGPIIETLPGRLAQRLLNTTEKPQKR